MSSLNHVAIFGEGLAFEMAIAAILATLPEKLKITAIEVADASKDDAFYGTLIAPDSMKLLGIIGLNERALILNTETSFSYGTAYSDWNERSWIQSFHQPFPLWEQVAFHHHLTRFSEPLEPFLVSAVCGKLGRFAHPPTDKGIPLSRADYGYHFHANEWADYLRNQNAAPNLTRISSAILDIETDDQNITAIKISDDTKISADLFIDITGSAGLLMEKLGTSFKRADEVSYTSVAVPLSAPSSLRTVSGNSSNWTARTTLNQKEIEFNIGPVGQSLSLDAKDISLGQRDNAWIGNCIALGHAACALEPISSAPMRMLQRDIERLLDLFPVSTEMNIEVQEFNRLFENDFQNCLMFNQVLKSETGSAKLDRKLTQFQSRGILVNYDFEPFNPEDWTILYFGLGQKPDRIDPLAENVAESVIQERLNNLKNSIENMAQKVPPCDRYLAKYRDYLKRNS